MSIKNSIFRGAILCLLTVIAYCLFLPKKPPATLRLFSYRASAMTTHVALHFYASSPQQAQQAAQQAFGILQTIAFTCSDYDAASPLSKINQNKSDKLLIINDLLKNIIEDSLYFAQATHGAFDPTIGRLSALLRQAALRGEMPHAVLLDEAKKRVGWQKVHITGHLLNKGHPDLAFDLGGIAKGWAADAMLSILQKKGIQSAAINIGGDLRLGQAPPGQSGWKVTVASSQTHQTLHLANCGIASSGDDFRELFIEKKHYSHIVHAHKGLHKAHTLSATVIACNGATADALATACCAMPERAGEFASLCFPQKQAPLLLPFTILLLKENRASIYQALPPPQKSPIRKIHP